MGITLIKANAAGGDGVPHRAGPLHDCIDISSEHESLGHEAAGRLLDLIEVVLFVGVALGDRETWIAGLMTLLTRPGEWRERTDEACQVFETP